MSLSARIDQQAVSGTSAVSRSPARLLQFLMALWEQFRQGALLIRASGLAYTALLALVPLVVVVFAFLSLFGVLDEAKTKVQDFVLNQFLPARSQEISEYLNTFTANAGGLGTMGFAVLIVTSILLLDSIERNFNDLWYVRNQRSLIGRINAYASALLFGALLIGSSLSVSARINVTVLKGIPAEMGVLTQLWNLLLPFALTTIGLLLLYLIVPDTGVRFRSALIGAVAAGTLFELGKHAFVVYAGRSVQYSTLYGSLAILPLFLVWLYLTWVIVLLGVAVTYTHQHFRTLVRSRQLRARGGDDRLSLAVEFALMVARRFHRGEDPPTLDDLSDRFLVPRGRAREIAEGLERAELIRLVGHEADALMPARALDRIDLAEVITASMGVPEAVGHSPDSLEGQTAEVLGRFRDGGTAALAGTSLGDIVEDESGPAPPGGAPA